MIIFTIKLIGVRKQTLRHANYEKSPRKSR